jgi:hypothetical protein
VTSLLQVSAPFRFRLAITANSAKVTMKTSPNAKPHFQYIASCALWASGYG